VIRIAIVPPTRRTDGRAFRKGSIWIKRGARARRYCLEGLTPNGVRLELTALFDRYLDETIDVMLLRPPNAEEPIVDAIRDMLPGIAVHTVNVGCFFFSAHRNRHREPAAFRLNLTGTVFLKFVPPWYEPPEPPILLRSVSAGPYTYPATDGDDDEVTNEEKTEE
jgi:hypothetical protein